MKKYGFQDKIQGLEKLKTITKLKKILKSNGFNIVDFDKKIFWNN